MYLHAYGRSGLEIATNTIAFVTEFLPLGVDYAEITPDYAEI